jgi:uncharacterized glyoxalase superfamily protein PhnB
VSCDPDGLADFYTAALDFAITADLSFPQGRVVRMRNGAAMLKIFTPVPAPSTGTATWPERTGFAYAALHVVDADAVVERAARAGATVVRQVTAHRPGARHALIADPEGNIWEILEEQQ